MLTVAVNLIFKQAIPDLFYVFYFRSFRTNIAISTKINVKSIHPVYSARDSNPQTSDHKSPQIATRPRLQPNAVTLLIVQ